ncbi:MAG: glycosyl hydrolase [Gemmatimonadetes bacterium]|nr:glycosyl hydrolase [Gemmatimonadota bacterium]
MKMVRKITKIGLILLIVPPLFLALDSPPKDLFPPLEWRSIGPNRGGRSIAVAGHKNRPNEYYFGATGGGLWKTEDSGSSWNPVTDGHLGSSSIGAIAVSSSNPDMVYVGMGEGQLRANVLQGDGIYKSSDAGNTWTHIGLAETQTITRIRVHPSDPETLYVAALGSPFSSNPHRGIFRTSNGGETWEKILYQDEKSGAIDLAVDPNNPDILYATLWQVYRRPWKLWSGGAGSGIFKSTDGGASWVDLTENPGFPRGPLGKITVTVSGSDSQRIWANVEANRGGLYLSTNAGSSWTLINDHRDLWQRAFYFQRIEADPIDANTIYVLNFELLKSTDSGKTFTPITGTHSDHHDLWIDPDDPSRMINANDGGGVITVNGGKTWTHMRYPTAQIYRLATTADFPYHACGAQQDNTTVCVASEGNHLRNPRGPSEDWMYAVGGGESGYVAPHPLNPDIFFGGATNTLTKYNRKTGLTVDIQPYPRIVMGEPAEVMRERWNWTYPITISNTNPEVLYVGSQHLWKSSDEGASWDKISPDLTRADPETLGDSGGPIVKDQDGPEIYGTIYSIGSSYFEDDVIWTGSDDGLVHVTLDGGQNWTNVTPVNVPPHTRITTIETSRHSPGSVYISGMRYEMGDRLPYLWKTLDYGETWDFIVDGIDTDDFTRVIRQDPKNPDVLYSGTERGVYISFNQGSGWHSLSLNLPTVPVTGLIVEERDLVISTHGRSFWILDDIETLRQVDPSLEYSQDQLFKPSDAIRRTVPAVIDYHIENGNSEVSLEVLDSEGRHVTTLVERTDHSPGFYRKTWNLRYPGAVTFPGIVLEGGNPANGPWAPPGIFQVRLTVGNQQIMEQFLVRKDPRLTNISEADLLAQHHLAVNIREHESSANQHVIAIRDLKSQINGKTTNSGNRPLNVIASIFSEKISQIEGQLYQVLNQSPKDKIAFPIKLNDRLTGLRSHLERGDGPPTESFVKVFEELSAELEVQIKLLAEIMEDEFTELNRALEGAGLTPIERPDFYIPSHIDVN